MEYELVRENIVLDRKIGNDKTQVLVEGEIIVPDVKPDMSVLLQTDAKANIDRVEVLTDRVNFVGKLDLQVLYLAKSSEKPVHTMSCQMPIDDFINLDGISKDMWVDAKIDIANIDYKMLNDRKISYRAILDVTVSGDSHAPHEVVTNINGLPENQLLKNNLKVNMTVQNKNDRFVVKEDLVIPPGKPNIRDILECSVNISNKDTKINNGHLTVYGELIASILYTSDDNENLIEFSEHEIPFSGTIDIKELKEDMLADVGLTVQDTYVHVLTDSDGEERTVDVEVALGVLAKIHSQETLEILEDAYALNENLNITKESVRYPRFVCCNKNQNSVKEAVSLDNNCPDILQIFKVKGHPVVDETRIIDDKVIAEGIIEADVLYIAESDETPLYSYSTIIPFKQVIETKGATELMDVDLKTSVDHIGFNMLSNREMELRFLLSFNTTVIEEKEVSMISDIQFNDIDKASMYSAPSMTVYVVQNGDTLWKIAKKYNTTIDDIVTVNEIENPDKVQAGQKLLVLKKVEI